MAGKIKLCIVCLALFIVAGVARTARAESDATSTIDNATSTVTIATSTINIEEAYKIDNAVAIKTFNGFFNMTFPAGSVSIASSTLKVTELNENLELPWRLDLLSKIYQFEINPEDGFAAKKPLTIQITYEKASNYLKLIYFFDKTKGAWRSLPTKDNPDKKTLTAEISLPYARVAVFADPDILAIGTASWYKYKTGNFTASPDFPKGTKLRVYNTDNGKHVDVAVNDFGPERNKFPDRVVDLEKTAFAKISSRKTGIVRIRIECLGVLDKKKKLSPAPEKVEPVSLTIKSKSAVVVNEQTGEVLYDKNSSSTLPLASLSKLVAIEVFIDTKPSLNQVVAYSAQDEKYNFALVDHPYEAATVKLKDGETLTIGDLLYSALVGSANNAVEALVRVSGMPRSDFIKKMNETAALWGATSTSFAEPTGLSPLNVSSPYDYAIITREVYQNPIIQKVSTMQVYRFSTINTKKKHVIRNTNSLIETNKFKITGSKTGYLNEAGYCLMTRATAKNGQQVIAVTFGAPTRNDSISETKRLLEYGLLEINSQKK